MRLHQLYHLSYCTNIHPGSDWKETLEHLKKHLPVIKSHIAPDERFGVGLRLSEKASDQLGTEENLAAFKDWLGKHNLYVFTINGFPYGNFHHERVKDKVHSPDWSTHERLVYTLRLFDQLAFLLPDNMRGGISTSPISYKHWYPDEKDRERIFRKASENLAQVVIHLCQLESESGKYMHLDIEPEPDGFLENTAEVLNFYRKYLLPVGIPVVARELGRTEDEAAGLLLRHINICYDTCHFALAFEEPNHTFSSFASAGIKIGKIQISAALRILPEGDNGRIWKALQKFDEPVYLHQVTELIGEDEVITYPDLPVVLEKRKPFEELRAHFHVPVFLEKFDALYSTQDQILKTLACIHDHPITEHLEVETYTWDVLPEGMKMDLDNMVSRELQWVIKKLDR